MTLKKLKKITGKIVVKTGLHIGMSSDRVEIGGMDNPIVRNPLTREPYIPGSSIKGKMRSLMEWKEGKVAETGGKPCSCGKATCPICRVFGSANNDGKSDKGPTRIIVRDAMLSQDDHKKIESGKSITEDKTENSLNRITAQANPRHLERVVPGVKFDFEIDYRIIDTGDDGKKDEELFNSIVLEGLKLLQNDYLGGGGSRGNGQIEFVELKEDDKPITL